MGTAAQRRKRWRELHAHLRDQGMKDIPDDYLQEPKPEWYTRPGMPLVAYFPCVTQKTVGRAAKFSTLPLTVALFALLLALLASLETGQSPDPGNIWDVITSVVHIVVAVGLAVGFFWSVRKLDSVEGPFHLDLKELSLELPTGSRHVPWADVYSVSFDPEKPDQLRVELQDGVAILVCLEAPDREPLEELMVELIRQHRDNHRPDGEPALNVGLIAH